MLFKNITEAVVLERLSYPEAKSIFQKYAPSNVDVAHLNPEDLKSLWKQLQKKHHPDLGGDLKAAQDINAAYDTLSSEPRQPRASSPRASSPDYSFSPRSQKSEVPEWAWAGWSGGSQPSSGIYRNDFSDQNYFKKTMWERSNHSKEEWTIRQFDGSYFRNIITVYGSKKIFRDMAEAMLIWGRTGNPYHTDAIFAHKLGSRNDMLIWLRGHHLDKPIDLRDFIYGKHHQDDLVKELDRLYKEMFAD